MGYKEEKLNLNIMIINITGIDGCGKTTQAIRLIEYLKSNGYKTYFSKAYGESEKEIFEKILPNLHQKAILFLFQYLHVQQFQNALKAEESGKIVVTDRWDDSYLVYHSQNGVLSKKKELRNQINELAFEKRKSDVTFFLDLDVNILMHRMKIRGQSFFEKRSIDFFTEMRKGYLSLAKRENWVIINGSLSIDTISQLIIDNIKQLI